jgi:aryl-alcohol dehydrogenase-like predicted oxidoreductase
MALIDAAAANDVFLMEAFMYRCHPQTARLVELIRDGAIGEVRLIRASFSYDGGTDMTTRAFAQQLGGGGILDVGCYPVSMSRLIAGAASGRAFVEPVDIKAQAHLGATGVDEWATALLKFPGDILAQVSTGVGLNTENGVHVFGSKGSLSVAEPWIPSRWSREPLEIKLRVHGEGERSVWVPAEKDLYAYEADMVGEHIAQRQAPAMSCDDTLGNMRVLDRWRDQIGLTYEMEKPANALRTITGRALSVKPNNMKYGRIEGVDKPVSRLIIGADTTHTMPDTAILFDAFFELGGNTFDTSHVYGHAGSCERNLGQWIRNRGIREEVVVLEKGGNHPNDSGPGLLREMQASLEITGLDYFDIYMLHRDNQSVPIAEWMDALLEGYNKGYMKAFGISNFTLPRLQAAVDYLAGKGAPKLCALSNNFSLARMLDPVWPGCESSSEPPFREWLELTRMPLFSWSSQARGFFTPRASRENVSSEEFNRCWYSEENFARKERAEILAGEKGVLPINIALAYVLCQAFPVFSLVGPKRRSEITSTMTALDIELSPQELAWLDLRAETPRG